jgi:hypothetical protein
VALPRSFCWTRFGTEAGEGAAQIWQRKERERSTNSGVFLWGIGNAVGASLQRLVSLEASPEVVFSPIRSPPRAVDIFPDVVVRWTAGRIIEGGRYEVPVGSLVTSRFKSSSGHTKHYALVCSSLTPLQIDTNGEMLAFRRLTNLVSGRRVGASQVTAVVQQSEHSDLSAPERYYRAVVRARLVFPYFVELTEWAAETLTSQDSQADRHRS